VARGYACRHYNSKTPATTRSPSRVVPTGGRPRWVFRCLRNLGLLLPRRSTSVRGVRPTGQHAACRSWCVALCVQHGSGVPGTSASKRVQLMNCRCWDLYRGKLLPASRGLVSSFDSEFLMYRFLLLSMLTVACASNNKGTASCDDQQVAARVAFNQFLSANKSCTTNTDCVHEDTQPSCLGLCPDTINRAGSADAGAYSEQLCASLQSQGCSVTLRPYCVACPEAVCDLDAGKCSCY